MCEGHPEVGLGWSPSHCWIIHIPEFPLFSGNWVVVSFPYSTGLFSLFLIDLWKLFTYDKRVLFLFFTYDTA